MQNAAAVKPLPAHTNLLCLPSAGGNPYQNLLYSALPETVDTRYGGPSSLELLNDGEFDVVHIHWDDRMFGRDSDSVANEMALARALVTLHQFK